MSETRKLYYEDVYTTEKVKKDTRSFWTRQLFIRKEADSHAILVR